MISFDWIVVLGIPCIVALTMLAYRRSKDLSYRIREFREQQETSSADPYSALAELLSDGEKQ